MIRRKILQCHKQAPLKMEFHYCCKSVALVVFVMNSFLLCPTESMAPGPKNSQGPHGSDDIIPVLKTDSTEYFSFESPANVNTAHKICDQNNAKLLSFQTPAEVEMITRKLSRTDPSFTGDWVWTSGISYSNASVEELFLWSDSMEPLSFSNFEDEEDRSQGRIGRTSRDDDCDCSCSTTTPAPFTRAPCKRPVCRVKTPNPPCTENKPRKCELTRRPNCEVKPRNCTVDCGEDCRITRQPVCRIKPSTRPRCELKPPGPCELSSTPNCTVTVGSCRAVQDKCEEEEGTCKPIIKPCKNPCTVPECTTVSPPCTTTVPTDCPSTNPPPTTASPCRMEKRCRKKKKRGSDNSDVNISCEMVPDCSTTGTTTSTSAPVDCAPVTTCPPPVTSCSKPFVDCSPEICQSSVQICLPPRINCPPVRIICDPPVVKCDTPAGQCPEPEVICHKPEVECDKPVVECPDAVVHCDPSLAVCDHVPVACDAPDMTCSKPEITCDEAVTCPPEETPATATPPCPCKGSKCTGRNEERQIRTGVTGKQRDSLSIASGAEYVEKLMCIAMKREAGFKWVIQSCNVKNKFICERSIETK